LFSTFFSGLSWSPPSCLEITPGLGLDLGLFLVWLVVL
jgi:hypothetical protein